MKSIIGVGVWFITLGAMLFVVPAHAEGLRGADYLTLEAGAFTYGDDVIDDAFGTHIDLFGSLNKALTRNVTLLGKIEGIYADGSKDGIDLTHTGVKAGLSGVYLIAPDNAANPYILAGGLFEYNQIEGSVGGDSESEDDTDVGFEVGGGVEFALGTQAIADVGLIYQSIGDFDSLTPTARLGFAFNEKTLGLLTVGYALDEEDSWIRAGLAVKL